MEGRSSACLTPTPSLCPLVSDAGTALVFLMFKDWFFLKVPADSEPLSNGWLPVSRQGLGPCPGLRTCLSSQPRSFLARPAPSDVRVSAALLP